MLLCKACNTRFGEGASVCPSCGRRAFSQVSDGPRRADAEPGSLPEARRLEEEPWDEPGGDTQVDVELEEVDLLAEAVDPSAVNELKPEPIARVRRQMREPGPAVFHLSPAQVRTLVAEQPDLLEPGLAIHLDAQRKPVGVDYRTPVGAIDLLARDGRGGLVVVMVPDPRDVSDLMPSVLARVGYVRKHVARAGQGVRGVVVMESIPESLAYAAAGVGETLSFKAYRVALTFHDLRL